MHNDDDDYIDDNCAARELRTNTLFSTTISNNNSRPPQSITVINVSNIEGDVNYDEEYELQNTRNRKQQIEALRNEQMHHETEELLGMYRLQRARKLAKRNRSTLGKTMTIFSNSLRFYNKTWSDIAYIVFDNIQLLSLIWILPLGLPYWFYNVMRFSLYFNLDFISSKRNIFNALEYLQRGSDQFPWYLIVWWIVPAIIILWIIIPRLSKFKYRTEFERILYTIIYMLYLPFVMHSVVYGICGASNAFGEFNCRFYCSDGRYYCLARSIPFLVITLSVIISVPILFWWESRKLMIYRSSNKHETLLRGVETELALDLTDHFVKRRYHLINSYKKNAVLYMMNIRFLQKLLIIAILCAVPSYNKYGKLDDQYAWIIGMVTWLVIVIPLFIELIWRPYRVLSPLVISQLLGWINSSNAFFGWMRAAKVRNPFLVDTNLVILMFCLNGSVLLLVILLCVFWKFIQRIQWPINGEVIHELQSVYWHYIEAIKNGYLLYEHAQSTHPMFVRCDLINRQKFILQQYYSEAIIQQNPLEDTLEDVFLKLEEEYYINEPYTILPHEQLQSVLHQLKANMDKRHSRMLLIPFHKKVILMKILAYGAFCDTLNRLHEKNKKIQSDPYSKLTITPSTIKNQCTTDVSVSQINAKLLQMEDEPPELTSPNRSTRKQMIRTETNIDDFLNPQSDTCSNVTHVSTTPQPSDDILLPPDMKLLSLSESLIIADMSYTSLVEYRKELKHWLQLFEKKFQEKYNKRPNKKIVQQMPQVVHVYNQYKLVQDEVKKRKTHHD